MDLDKALYMSEFLKIREDLGTTEIYSFTNTLYSNLYDDFKPKEEIKLVRCIRGSVLDTIVDLRQSSETFGEWYSVKLDRPELQLWVPPGFAHGFLTLSENAQVCYC